MTELAFLVSVERVQLTSKPFERGFHRRLIEAHNKRAEHRMSVLFLPSRIVTRAKHKLA
jgi:hypothetical protein